MTDTLVVLRRRWPWVIVAPLLAVICAALYASSRPVSYEATSRVLLDATAAQEVIAGSIDVDTDVEDRDLVNEVNLARSDVVVQQVASQLNLNIDELDVDSVTADPESDVLIFEVRRPTAEGAADLANTWAQIYVDRQRGEAQASIDELVGQLEAELADLRSDRDQVRRPIAELETELSALDDPVASEALRLRIEREERAIAGELDLVDTQIAAAVDGITQVKLSRELASSAQIVQAASPPSEPAGASTSLIVAAAAVVGLLAGLGLAVGRDRLGQAVHSSEDVRRLGAHLLGEIPKAPSKLASTGMATISHTMPGGIYADSYQKVRAAVEFAISQKQMKSILITSPHDGDGKSTLAVNLATAFANTSSRVVLIDLDHRRPSLHEHFSAQLAPGFSDALNDNIPLDKLSVSTPRLAATLRVLPAGTCPNDPAAFVASPKLASVIQQLRASADIVLLDAPAVMPAADALSASSAVDGVIVVAKAGQTKQDDFVDTIQAVTRAGGTPIGVVLNQVATTGQSAPHPGAVNSAAAQREFAPMRLFELRHNGKASLPTNAATEAAATDAGPGQSSSLADQDEPAWSANGHEPVSTDSEDPSAMSPKGDGTDAADNDSDHIDADSVDSEELDDNDGLVIVDTDESIGDSETIGSVESIDLDDPAVNGVAVGVNGNETAATAEGDHEADAHVLSTSQVTSEIDRSEIDKLLDEL